MFFHILAGCKKSTIKVTSYPIAPAEQESKPLSDGIAGQLDPNKENEPETLSAEIAQQRDPNLVIYFDFDSGELSDSAKGKLDRIARILNYNTDIEITRNGFSDSSGSSAYNQMVSETRAYSAKYYLIGKGISPSRIAAVGRGATDFIAGNETAEGRRLNRRVEIELKSD